MFEAFKEVKALIENQKGKKVKFLQSDNGTEYVNERFDNFLKETGIARRLTVPYHPQQNGVLERKNRTLMNIARCLLIQANLPDHMWAEAVNTANYLKNRCPTSFLGDRTPYKIWHNYEPEVGHLRKFGCKVFCLDTKPKTEKFDPRTKEGRFVGYSDTSKAYQVWFPDDRNIQAVRDIKFLEEKLLIFRFPERTEQKNPFIELQTISDELQYEDDDNPIDFQEISEEGEVEHNESPPLEAVKRGPGAPRIERTGRTGRPKKIYNMIPVEEADITCVEEIFLAEISMNKAWNPTSGLMPRQTRWCL